MKTLPKFRGLRSDNLLSLETQLSRIECPHPFCQYPLERIGGGRRVAPQHGPQQKELLTLFWCFRWAGRFLHQGYCCHSTPMFVRCHTTQSGAVPSWLPVSEWTAFRRRSSGVEESSRPPRCDSAGFGGWREESFYGAQAFKEPLTVVARYPAPCKPVVLVCGRIQQRGLLHRSWPQTARNESFCARWVGFLP
jgi:hypothetical protein